MEIKGNRGDWSEFYAFIKILTDGELFAADRDLNLVKEKFFTVLRIIREEKKVRTLYDISKNNGEILVMDDEERIVETVPSERIKKGVGKVFEMIKGSSKGTFGILLANDLMKELHCTKIKASNSRKTDLAIIVHDSVTPTTPELGFSIKSMLGSPSTLFNASGATNFLYKVIDTAESKEAINSIGGTSKVMDRSKKVYGTGGSIVFLDVENENLRKNLKKIDSNFSKILAEILRRHYCESVSKVSDLVDLVASDTEFCEKIDFDKSEIELNVKRFLSAVALGMTPVKLWSGTANAHGGYIIVKENGEVVCYHLYNRDEFEEYLYRNTKLDTPSTTRHKFGSVYEENGEKRIKYNLQIRFIK